MIVGVVVGVVLFVGNRMLAEKSGRDGPAVGLITIDDATAGLALPARSCCVAERATVPFAGRFTVGTIDHVPAALTTPVPMTTWAVPRSRSVSANKVTVVPTSPVPVIKGR